MAAPQYTTCVQPEDYKEPNLPGGNFLVAFGQVTVGGGLDVLRKVCDYLLHGKLVCLGGDVCAIGRVAEFQTVDDKSGFEQLDNDFSIRILLCPDSLSLMGRGEENRVSNYEIARQGPQGELITEQASMPVPLDPKPKEDQGPSPKYWGTYVDFDAPYFGPPVVYPTSADAPYKVPVLHCEIEGDRIAAVCAAFQVIWNPVIETLCAIPLFGWLICLVISIALLPVILTTLATAWAAGSNDNRSFEDAGSLEVGDTVVITGRWVYDAGHAGWNEIHAVKSVQKIDDAVVCAWQTFDDLHERWCDRVNEVPPEGAPGSRPAAMTPAQETVWEGQVDSKNRWVYHPAIDGCAEPMEPPK